MNAYTPRQIKALWLPAIIALALLMTVAACGGSDADPDPTPPTPNVPTGKGQMSTPTTASTSVLETRSGRMTLEETRSWCTEFDKQARETFSHVEGTGTWGDVVEAYSFTLAALGRVAPPEELEEFWQAWRRGADAGFSFAHTKPSAREFKPQELEADSELQAATKAIQDIVLALQLEGDDAAYNVAVYCAG